VVNDGGADDFCVSPRPRTTAFTADDNGAGPREASPRVAEGVGVDEAEVDFDDVRDWAGWVLVGPRLTSACAGGLLGRGLNFAESPEGFDGGAGRNFFVLELKEH